MVATDPGNTGPTPGDAEDERAIAALCRSARFQNEEIHKKRERLRVEIRHLQAKCEEIEARYWQEYQQRLAVIADSNPKGPTRKWISVFAEQEKTIADAVQKFQDMLRTDTRLKQQELQTVDGEFWCAWSKHVDKLRGLTPMPSPSGPAPSTVVPVQHQHTNGQADNALPAPQNGNQSSDSSRMPFNGGKKQSAYSSGRPTDQPLPKNWRVTMKPTDAQGPNLEKDLNKLVGLAFLATKEVRHPAAPAQFPDEPPSDPNTRPTVNKQQHQPLTVTTAAAPGSQGDDHKSQFSALSPQSLTPMSVYSGLDSKRGPSQEPVDNALTPDPRIAVPAKSPAKVKGTTPNTRSRRKSAAAEPVVPYTPSPSKLASSQEQNGTFNVVINPQPGELYQAYYKDPTQNYEGWWMCTVLPWDNWEREVGIRFNMQKANLFQDLPDCYTTDRVRAKPRGRATKPVIKGWQKGFEAGGPRVRERVFPVLFFDDTPGEPGNFTFPAADKPFIFSKQALKALPAEWVAAADLRHVGVDVGRPVAGRETAAQFRERVVALREIQARKRLSTPKKPKGTISFSPINASSLVDTSSLMEDSSTVEPSSPLGASPLVEASTKDEVEMADAESLSGATAVDDTAGQPEAMDVDMADPATKSQVKGILTRRDDGP